MEARRMSRRPSSAKNASAARDRSSTKRKEPVKAIRGVRGTRTGRHGDIPLQQVLSFVTHDIYGPASMLRTYLSAVSGTAGDPELRAMILDAERLSAQVESMLRLLQLNLRMATGVLELTIVPVDVHAFLNEWQRAIPTVQRDDRIELSPDVRVMADEGTLAVALQGAAWQIARMGNRQGMVSVGIVAEARGTSDATCAIGLWRGDGQLDGETLRRAAIAREEDWTLFLRRLPACDFPLRIALRLLQAMGGYVEIRGEETMLVVALPVRT